MKANPPLGSEKLYPPLLLIIYSLQHLKVMGHWP
jgi:hypothetical protein